MTTGIWIFRGLLVLGIAFFAFVWFMPLWGLDIAMLRADAVLVRSWGEELNIGNYAQLFPIPSMPGFFPALMWIYMGLCLLLLAIALICPARPVSLARFTISLPQLLVGSVGLSQIVFVAVAAIVITIMLGTFEVDGVTTPLQGTVTLNFGQPYITEATSSLRSGYWLTLISGLYLLFLAWLHSRFAIGDRPVAEAKAPQG